MCSGYVRRSKKATRGNFQKEGVGVMPPSDYEKRIVAMFDSFCKTVVRNCSRNLKRTKRNADKHSIGEPVEFLLELLGQAAQSSHERMVLHADELSCEIQSETLYEALCSLPEAQRKVLLLGFWGGFGDEEIARRLSVTPRTVYNLRQRAFKVVKAFYEQKRAPP